jgi:hypothetical protein
MPNTTTQEKTGYEMAAEYAAGVEEGLETLDTLVEGFDAVVEYLQALADCDPADADDAETLAEARDDAEIACGGSAQLVAAACLFRELGEPEDASEAVAAWVDGLLDVEISGRHTGNGWEVTEVSFLVTSGGPSARVVWDGSRTLAVRCSWSSEEIVRRVFCDALLDYAAELAETVEVA